MKLAVLFALLAFAAVAEAGKIESRFLLSSGPKYCDKDADCGAYEMCKQGYGRHCTYKKDCHLVDTRFCKTYNTAQKCFTFKGPCEVPKTKKICRKEHVCAEKRNLDKCSYDKVCIRYDEQQVCKPNTKCVAYDYYGKCKEYGKDCETKKVCVTYKREKKCVPGREICIRYELVDTTDCWEIKTGCLKFKDIQKCTYVRGKCKEFKKRQVCKRVEDRCYSGTCVKKG